MARRTLDAIDLDFWQTVADVNMTSLMVVTRQALPFLAAAGEKDGWHGGSLAYSTMKGAVLTFTRSLSGEVAGKGIRVNAVAPGLILGT